MAFVDLGLITPYIISNDIGPTDSMHHILKQFTIELTVYEEIQ